MHIRGIAVALALSLCALPVSAARRRAVRSPSPPEGPCLVRGLANVFYSTDGGVTWSGNAEAPSSQAFAWDIAVLDDEPESLVAAVGNNIFDSYDAGCTWTLRHTITQQIKHTVHLVPASGGRVFLWTEDFALRYDRGTVTTVPIPQAIGGLGVDPGNREHVRILDLAGGKARESFDGGATWQDVGGSAGGTVIAAAFDPSDFRHIVAGIQARGIVISRDGGHTWTSGASSSRGVCDMAFVRDQPNVLWVTLASQSGQALMHRSADAGAHLEPIASIDGLENSICLLLIPNPRDANLAVITFRDVFTFNATLKNVTSWTCCNGRMDRVAYSRKDPARIYAYSGVR